MKDVKIIIIIWSLLAILSIANSIIFPMALFVKIISWLFGALNIFAIGGFVAISKEVKRLNKNE